MQNSIPAIDHKLKWRDQKRNATSNYMHSNKRHRHVQIALMKLISNRWQQQRKRDAIGCDCYGQKGPKSEQALCRIFFRGGRINSAEISIMVTPCKIGCGSLRCQEVNMSLFQQEFGPAASSSCKLDVQFDRIGRFWFR